MTTSKNLKRLILFGIISLCSISISFALYKTHLDVSPPQLDEEEIQGWGKNANRDVRLYVTGDFPGTRFRCPARLLLLVVVFSAPSNANRRDAVRASWASLADNQTRVAFIIGDPADKAEKASIDLESIGHEDIIRASCVDTYENLTLKAVMMLQWATRHCPQARFLLKADDDVYVNLPALSKMVAPLAAKGTKDLLIGQMHHLYKPIRDSRWKWYCPHYIYNESFFPDYVNGPAYLMSSDVVPRLYSASFDIPIVPLEDVYITGMCAKAVGLVPHQYDGFELYRRPPGRLSTVLAPFLRTMFVWGHGHEDALPLHRNAATTLCDLPRQLLFVSCLIAMTINRYL